MDFFEMGFKSKHGVAMGRLRYVFRKTVTITRLRPPHCTDTGLTQINAAILLSARIRTDKGRILIDGHALSRASLSLSRLHNHKSAHVAAREHLPPRLRACFRKSGDKRFVAT